jgi:hypothetical protein
VTCRMGWLADGAAATKKIVVRADEDGRLRNATSVRSAVRDPNADNNADAAATRVEPERDAPAIRTSSIPPTSPVLRLAARRGPPG